MMKTVAGLILILLLFTQVSLSKAHGQVYKPVDVALVLAVDVSGSVSDANYKLQRDGLASALASPTFQRVLQTNFIGRIAISLVEWGTDAKVKIPWTVVETRRDALLLAAEIRNLERAERGSTCMDTPLNKALELLIPWEILATRMIIDIHGDGKDNCNDEKFKKAKQAVVDIGATINGLPIITPSEPKVDVWYADNVMSGPGAFLVVANGFADFERAFNKKFIQEISLSVLP